MVPSVSSIPDQFQLPLSSPSFSTNMASPSWLTAALYNAVIEEAPRALLGIKQLLIGGEALSITHVLRGLALLPNTQIINGHGPTEGTTFTCCYPIARDLTDRPATSIPIGRPIGNTQVYILDQQRNPVPVGITGELYIGGDGLAGVISTDLN